MTTQPQQLRNPAVPTNPPADFNQDYYVTLPASGLPVMVNCIGTFFNCFQAANEFEMSLNGSNFFSWNLGLAMHRPNGFNRIWFRATNGIDTDISFYAGNVEVTNTQLNIVNNESQFLAVSSKIPLTYLKNTYQSLAGGATLALAGTDNGNQRKDIYIFNLDASLVLAVADGSGNIGGIVYPQDNLPLENSATVQIINQNAAAVQVCVIEHFYSA